MISTPDTLYACYACPVCQEPLMRSKSSLQCVNKHNFDVHKKGYVNLLLAQHKNSKAPGDNSEMVKGRHDFLSEGHYQAFADAIIKVASSIQDSTSPNLTSPNSATQALSVLDAGCGEGFYTEQLQKNLASPHVYGLDISKPAITSAARHKDIHWCVASSSRPPFIANSLDLIVSIFSPIEEAAFLNVLKPKGYILYAGSGDNHLPALRNIIYDQVKEYSSDKHHEYFGDSLTLIQEQSLQVPIHLNSHDRVMQLVNMTPHAHRISKAGYERLKQTESLSDSGDFKIYLYQKN